MTSPSFARPVLWITYISISVGKNGLLIQFECRVFCEAGSTKPGFISRLDKPPKNPLRDYRVYIKFHKPGY